MIRRTPSRSRWLPALSLAAALVLAWPSANARTETPPPAAAGASAPRAAPTHAGAAWAHELTGRAPDPAVRFGRLPNGLRYAIQHNLTPKDGVAMRLHIAAGSMAERDDEQGLAHFLEHMAFRGSRNLADGEVVKLLERQGLRFGPDTNAFTAHDQTVYQFNFPRADATALDTGLRLFREIGERLTLDAQLLEQEKGVILSEERARDVPPLRAARAELGNLLAGTRHALRWPIGQVETIRAATPERLRRYYQAHYRPDKATLVVVGAIDVDAVERDIRHRFADWQPAGPGEVLDMGQPQPAQPAVEFTAEGSPDRLSLAWVRPPDLRAPTLAVEREQLLAQLAVGVLNQRLADRALQPGSPYTGAGAGLQLSVARVAQLTQLNVVTPAAGWAPALDAALQALRRLQADGVQPADLQRLLPTVRSRFDAAVAQAGTRESAQIADALVRAAHEGSVYTSAAQDLADVQPLLAALKPEDLSAALHQVFQGQGPVLFRAAQGTPAGVPALAQQLAQSLSRPLAAAQAQAEVLWPYTDFGTPAAVVERQVDAELGTTTLRYANGARLVIKPTAQEKDQISVQVRLGQGLSGLPRDRASPVWAMGALTLGGFGRLSIADYQKWKQAGGLLLSVGLAPDTRAFVLNGATRPADLPAQMQALAALARDPGFRPELGEKLGAMGTTLANQLAASAGAMYFQTYMRASMGDDLRFDVLPTPELVAATRLADLEALLRAPLALAPDVIIVGDTTVAAAEAAMQASFGAGPARARAPALPVQISPLANGSQRSTTHAGRPDQAVLGQLWPLPDAGADEAQRATAQVAAAIVQARLVDTVREQLGITYSPRASVSTSREMQGHDNFSAMIETPPDKFDTFRNLLRTQLQALAAQPVPADELQRARTPLLESARKAPEKNQYWLQWLHLVLLDPALKPAMLGWADRLQAVTPEQVQAFFRQHIVARQPIEVISRAR